MSADISANSVMVDFGRNESAIFLKEKLQNVKDKQGLIGSIWNGLKEFTSLGVSASDCESMIQKYQAGAISFEEAAEYINKFDKKQDNIMDLAANIGTGVMAIAATAGTTATAPLIGIGAGVGFIAKAGIKFLDKATNNVNGDEYNVKSIIKDGISGSMTGITSAVPASLFKSANSVSTGKKLLFEDGFKCGAACGGASGFVGYMTDVAFGDKEFDLKECAKTTAVNAGISAPVGGAIAAYAPTITGGLSQMQGDMVASTAKKLGKRIIQDVSGAA